MHPRLVLTRARSILPRIPKNRGTGPFLIADICPKSGVIKKSQILQVHAEEAGTLIFGFTHYARLGHVKI